MTKSEKKRQYELIAKSINFRLLEEWRFRDDESVEREIINAIKVLAREIATRLERADPHFDRWEFLRACGINDRVKEIYPADRKLKPVRVEAA